jgi:hypothetical protein
MLSRKSTQLPTDNFMKHSKLGDILEEKQNIQRSVIFKIFLKEELMTSEEERKSIYSDQIQLITLISMILSEF